MRSLTLGLRAPPVEVFGPQAETTYPLPVGARPFSEFACDPDARGMNVGARCRKMIFTITYFHAMYSR